MASTSVECVQEYLDDNGDRWTVRTVMRDWGLDLQITAPGLEPRILRPANPTPCSTSRPSVDSDVPLPLESL